MGESIKTIQTAWNCRWSRLGYRLDAVLEHEQPESLWVCVRPPNARRSVTEEECATCECWEAAAVPETKYTPV